MNTIVVECNSAYLGTPCPKIKKLKKYICAVYDSPSLKWSSGRRCPFRYEISEENQKKQVNPLKASKQANKR